jgi:hypothetical protein
MSQRKIPIVKGTRAGDFNLVCSWRPAITFVALITASALAAGCSSTSVSEMEFFPNRGQLFKSQSWGSATRVTAPDVMASGPVSPEDEVDAAGRCAVAQSPQADVAVGTVAGDLGSTTPTTPAEQGVAPGGIALGMTECQVVAHAGQAGQVNVGLDEAGQRKVVLTYAAGPWPGIYTFASGRLKVIDRVAQPERAKPARKKARSPRAASAPAKTQ